jgi:hypothetical protein
MGTNAQQKKEISMLKSSFIAMSLLVAGSAYADEVIIHRDPDVPVVVEHSVPPPADAVVIERRRPCQTTTTHTEDDTGASRTVTQRDCD